MQTAKIRLATQEDIAEIYEIYRPYVQTTSVTFDCDITLEVMAQRVETIRKTYPYLVCVIDSHIAGYAYASNFKVREAYSWTVEPSVYVSQNHQRQHIATALYTALFDCLKEMGFYKAIAILGYPNTQSLNLHKAFGFTEKAILEKAGYKLGMWRSVMLVERTLREPEDAPLPTTPLRQFSKTPQFTTILNHAQTLVRL